MRAPAILLGLATTLGACTTENQDPCYQNTGLCREDGGSKSDGSPDVGIDMGAHTDAMTILDAAFTIDQGTQPADAGVEADEGLDSDATVGAPDFAIDAFVPPVDALAPIDAAPQTPDAFVPPANACRIKIAEVLEGAGNLQLFCGPGTHQVDGNVNAYILGPNGICNTQDHIASQVWVLVSPTRATFEQEGDCSNVDGGSGLTIFSGDRTNDVPTNEEPRRTAEQLRFIDNPPANPTLTIDGSGDRDIATYFDARGTNLNPQR